MFFRCLLSCRSLANPSPIANPHLKLQIALTWTIDAITLLKNTIWLDTSALLDLDRTMMSDLFLSPKLQIPHRF